MKPSIHFHIRLDRPAKNGSVPIYLVFLIDRKNRTKISIGKSVLLKKEYQGLSVKSLLQIPLSDRKRYYCWDENLERVTPLRDPLNNILDKEKARAISIIEKFELMEQPLSVDSFLAAYTRPKGNNNFKEYFQREVIEKRKNTMARDTIKNFNSTINKVWKFRPNITLADITYKFLCEFEDYMLKPTVQKGLGNIPSTASKTMRVLRTLLLVAVKNGDLHKENYPFKNYSIKHIDPVLTSRDYLEPDALLKTEQLLSAENVYRLTGSLAMIKYFTFLLMKDPMGSTIAASLMAAQCMLVLSIIILMFLNYCWLFPTNMRFLFNFKHFFSWVIPSPGLNFAFRFTCTLSCVSFLWNT